LAKGGAGNAPNRRPEQQRDTRMRLEQWARNPKCEANTVSAVHNVKMATVAERTGVAQSFGASPFALARGEEFEFNLLRDDAERLLPELVRTGVGPEADVAGVGHHRHTRLWDDLRQRDCVVAL
jgi:hypothetical protein